MNFFLKFPTRKISILEKFLSPSNLYAHQRGKNAYHRRREGAHELMLKRWRRARGGRSGCAATAAASNARKIHQLNAGRRSAGGRGAVGDHALAWWKG